MALVYGFNFQAAERAFQEAAAADPKAAMPYWGLALAEGPNYNSAQPNVAQERAASLDLTSARERAAALPRSPEATEEQAYIAALNQRLSCAPHPPFAQLESAYGAAMKLLSQQNPNDPDATVLYAESLLEQRGWQMWADSGTTDHGAQQVLEILEAVLRRWPNHIGANHLYIHAAEASGDPGRALPSADRLALLAEHGFAGDGHLLHMPAHIYLRTGRFMAAEQATLAAAAADRAYLAAQPSDTGYAAGLAEHNLAFVVFSAEMDGDYPTAIVTARELARRAELSESAFPENAAYELAPMAVLVRFARWSDILALPPEPHASESYQAYWHYARASAFAGRGDWRSASRELVALRQFLMESRQILISVPPLARPTLHNILIGSANGRIAVVNRQFGFAVQQWRRAISAQDAIGYREPPPWYPLRESLGAALLLDGHAAQAADVFRESLVQTPGDPRALFGLWQALRELDHNAQAENAHRQFVAAWKGGELRIEDL